LLVITDRVSVILFKVYVVWPADKELFVNALLNHKDDTIGNMYCGWEEGATDSGSCSVVDLQL
jgi:hypothetical protein